MNVSAPTVKVGLEFKKNWGMFLSMFLLGGMQVVGSLTAQGFGLLSSDTYNKLYWEYQSIFMALFGVLALGCYTAWEFSSKSGNCNTFFKCSMAFYFYCFACFTVIVSSIYQLILVRYIELDDSGKFESDWAAEKLGFLGLMGLNFILYIFILYFGVQKYKSSLTELLK